MKITIELDENLPDDEIRIHCRRMTEELQKFKRHLHPVIRRQNGWFFIREIWSVMWMFWIFCFLKPKEQ